MVIRLLRTNVLCSRADLAKLTGLKQATITNIINDLIRLNLVTETGLIDGQKGRRSIGITLNSDLYKVVAVRLARKYFSVGLFDLFGSEENIVHETIDVFESSGEALKRIKKVVTGLIEASSSRYRILGIGVAIPGPFFRIEGRIALMTEFPGWEQIAFEDEFRSGFSVPVFLEHDANAGVLAEWWLGRHSRETGTMVYVAAGQGVGAGIVIDGRLFRGALGIAGEIGHMSIEFDGPKCECGNKGCLEHYCSTIAVMRDVKSELVDYADSPLQKDHSIQAILREYRAGDPLAQKALRKAASYLGFGLVNIINTLNPDVIVIGDELAQAGTEFLELVQNTIKNHLLPSIYDSLRVELSSFEIDPIMVGVSTLVVEKTLQRLSSIEDLAGAVLNTKSQGKKTR
jgi:predicted NBD/HSP70 family sugar kinase